MDTLSIKEKNVLMNEVNNDGKTAYLYYSTKYKGYVAYGISAYITYRVDHSVKAEYNKDLQMPMAVVSDRQVARLKKGLQNIMEIEDEYLQLEATQNYDEEGYEEWAGFLRSQYAGS